MDRFFCFYRFWGLKKDFRMISTPESLLIYELKVWKRWEANSNSNLVRISQLVRSVYKHQLCWCWDCSFCEFYIWSLGNDFVMIPTLRLSFLCLVVLWNFVLANSIPRLGGIGQKHLYVFFRTAVIHLLTKIIIKSLLGIFGSFWCPWKATSWYSSMIFRNQYVCVLEIGEKPKLTEGLFKRPCCESLTPFHSCFKHYF